MRRIILLHLALVATLAAAAFVLPQYHHTNAARIMVLAVYAMGYNLAFGYTGLLSLGHAMFFGAGMYGTGLLMQHLGWSAGSAAVAGILAGAGAALLTGLLALRTAGVSFMIVTLMFAQAGYMTILYHTDLTRGEEGFVLAQGARTLLGLDLSADMPRYFAALALFATALGLSLWVVRSRLGQLMVAMRENEERSRMLGHDPLRVKLAALTLSGAFAGAAGAAYALMFGYVGASFAAIPFSILPLLWVLTGGAGTTLGPVLGVAVMFYLVDLASGWTTAHLLVVGVALVALVLFAPQGILGTLRERGMRWLP